MDMEDNSNLLESFLAEYNSKLHESEKSGASTSRNDSSNLRSGKRKAPVKPKRKTSVPPTSANIFLGDLDLGEPVNVQEIIDSVTVRNSGSKLAKSTLIKPQSDMTRDDKDSGDYPPCSGCSVPEDDDDQVHIYNDLDHSFADYEIPSLQSLHYDPHVNSFIPLQRKNCSMEDLSITSFGDKGKHDSQRGLKSSSSVQSNLQSIGVDSPANPSSKLGRLGSHRRQNKNPIDKEVGQFLDSAALNASTAYAKLRQLKNKAKKDILKVGKGGQTKIRRDLVEESSITLNSSSDAPEILNHTIYDNASRLDDESIIKRGWLKKQGGVRKNWSDRWFCLTERSLYYYKNRDEVKSCGMIPITNVLLEENPITSEGNTSKYLFEIITESSKKSQTQILAAATKSDKDSWIKAIKRAIGGRTSSLIFGQSLSQVIFRQKKMKKCPSMQIDRSEVPHIIVECCEFIRNNKGFDEEGLFRLPGQADEVQQFRDEFDNGIVPTFDNRTDVHTVASLLKSYLRELPEPVLPFDMYWPLIGAAKEAGTSKHHIESIGEFSDQFSNEMQTYLKDLPNENFELLKYLCEFLDDVQQHSIKNKMDTDNLALVFGPNILRKDDLDPMVMMSHSTYVQYVMSQLIVNRKSYFGEVKDMTIGVLTSIPDATVYEDDQDPQSVIEESSFNRGSISKSTMIPMNEPKFQSSVDSGTRRSHFVKAPPDIRTVPSKPIQQKNESSSYAIGKPGIEIEHCDNVHKHVISLSCSPTEILQERNIERKCFEYSSENSIGKKSLQMNSRDSDSKVFQENLNSPRPLTRRGKDGKEITENASILNSRTRKPSSSDIFEDVSEESKTRTGSGSADSSLRDRSRSTGTIPRRPNVRPPPPPGSQRRNLSGEKTYEELKNTVEWLEAKLLEQDAEFRLKLQNFEDDLLHCLKKLRLHSPVDLENRASLGLNQSFNKCHSDVEEVECLRKRIEEERRQRRIVELQLQNERRGRTAAEKRNEELVLEILQLR